MRDKLEFENTAGATTARRWIAETNFLTNAALGADGCRHRLAATVVYPDHTLDCAANSGDGHSDGPAGRRGSLRRDTRDRTRKMKIGLMQRRS